MLLSFSFKNFRCFKDETFFSTEATKLDKNKKNSFKVHENSDVELLPVSAIYGANASGKTNLLSAISLMKRMVLTSHRNEEEEEMPRYSFAFSEKKEPTEFEINFYTNTSNKEFGLFTYGFSYNKEQIITEYLYIKSIETNRKKHFFERTVDNEGKSKFAFTGSNIKKDAFRNIVSKNILQNRLFLSSMVNGEFGKSNELIPITQYFRNLNINTNFTDGMPYMFFHHNTIKMIEGDGKEKIIKHLRKIGILIDDIIIEETKEKDFYLPNKSIKFIYKKANGENVSLDMFRDESQGTRQFLSILADWITALEEGGVIIVDELDSSLHPDLLVYLVKTFNDLNINKRNAQLIFTCHNTVLLSPEKTDGLDLRKDQVWITNKDNNKTELYSIAEIKGLRQDTPLEKAYFAGIFGGKPLLEDF